MESIAADLHVSHMTIYRIVLEHTELADNPIYQEARRRRKKFIRDTYKPPEGGNKCESGVARGLIDGCSTKEEEVSDIKMDIEKQEGKREVEKFVHGLRNGEI
eukprot:6172859-Pleurochrysis_carterae.AAC.1